MYQAVIREARESDAAGMSAVMKALKRTGKRTKPSDPDFALNHYIKAPNRIRCSIAVGRNSEILGFQSLKFATEGNPYGATAGWGIIGTHIDPAAARLGIGRALFQATLAAARDYGVPAIDATIGAENTEGLAYYEAMGFREYRRIEGAICKAFRLV